ncbi:MAG: tyrosine-type recombinase/integrase [Bacteroidia bacterium]|nr:tyrosine-type recombinase/integrase [Bacteroidia bacterium]NNC86589.1 tyrosine-type recombinase/integrase [Bacteroidia bacterium]NNM16305.1 tyrosine-type recombinase/integrase [Bacteroidia bacterium]
MPISSFINYLQFEKRYSPHTIKSYQTDLGQFFIYIKSQYQMEDGLEVGHFHIRSWIVSLMEAEISPKSINRKIATLNTYFKFLIREGKLEKSPMTKIQAPKTPKKLPSVVTTAQMNIVLEDQLDESDIKSFTDYLIIEILYQTGMRRAELVNLLVGGFSKTGSTLKVLGKRNKERLIPIQKQLVEKLELYLEKRNKILNKAGLNHSNLLINESGKPLYDKYIYRVVNKYLGAVSTQQKKSPHMVRHSFATHLLENGADINAVKELLGHANLAATQIYTHNTIEKLKRTYKQAHPKA